ncbi:hypothetical protein [Streptomyces sp. NPDC014734]|uniref:hypothetical protein n=1 Tax=Streptomyces sp. NPDC014734 TaxID=3364886 RepID=UPI0036F9B157
MGRCGIVWPAGTGEENALCARHLHDLTNIGGSNAAAVLADNRDRWNAGPGWFRALLAEGGGRRPGAGRRLPATPRCRACEEERTAGLRQAALLTVQLRNPYALARTGTRTASARATP